MMFKQAAEKLKKQSGLLILFTFIISISSIHIWKDSIISLHFTPPNYSGI